MERTSRGPTLSEVMTKMAELELRVRDFMLIFSAIAYMQEDKKFDVSITDIKNVPKGSSCDFSFNRRTDMYEFAWVPPVESPEATGQNAEGKLIVPASAISNADEKLII
jgi:hypothetical protein